MAKSKKVIDIVKKTESMWDKPKETKYNVLSLGAGVQSSVLALMIARGELPMVDFAIFSDTQAEPKEVYEWLEWLTPHLPFPVHVVTQGNLTEDSLKPRFRQKDTTRGPKGSRYAKRIIPMFGIKDGPEGKHTAIMGRNCTADYKVRPIRKALREHCGIKRGQKECTVTQWIGISTDEMQRAKYPDDPWTQHYWPLLDKRMNRADCIQWMRDNGYPEPPRSACYYCPFHDDGEWARMKRDMPEFWEKAVQFDKDLREVHKSQHSTLSMEVFLHRSCIPLDEVDLKNCELPAYDFTAECEGLCGI